MVKAIITIEVLETGNSVNFAPESQINLKAVIGVLEKLVEDLRMQDEENTVDYSIKRK